MAATATKPTGELRAGVAALQALFKSDVTEGQSADGAWNRAWKSATTPWDNLGVQPALKELVEESWDRTGVKWELLSGRSLVAGCGRGYDATFFAQKGFESLGVDIAPAAVDAATEWLVKEPNAPTNVEFKCLDFFASPELAPSSFALAYDYTFLCAIPPSLRTKWAARYAELIRPGGVLVALQFPLDGDRAGGPPYSLSPEIYNDLLLDKFELVYHEKPGKSQPGHEGKEMIAVFKRKE